MDKLTTLEIVELIGCHKSTANSWARKHSLEAVKGPKGKVAMYFWSIEDIEAFQARPKPGRRWEKEK
jgi:hypothetical protein